MENVVSSVVGFGWSVYMGWLNSAVSASISNSDNIDEVVPKGAFDGAHALAKPLYADCYFTKESLRNRHLIVMTNPSERARVACVVFSTGCFIGVTEAVAYLYESAFYLKLAPFASAAYPVQCLTCSACQIAFSAKGLTIENLSDFEMIDVAAVAAGTAAGIFATAFSPWIAPAVSAATTRVAKSIFSKLSGF
ncbi:MAG: hypothetical protein MRY21_06095 [Simkaniaceae bacterium]|nr:hypothetical protein [Simkaniaceae bacterium]